MTRSTKPERYMFNCYLVGTQRFWSNCERANLSEGVDSFDEHQEDDDPTHEETQCKLPANFPHILNSVRDLKNVIAENENKKFRQARAVIGGYLINLTSNIPPLKSQECHSLFRSGRPLENVKL